MKSSFLSFPATQSGLFSATTMVFMAGGNHKMLCGPIAANALLIAQMSYDLINMLNGTHDDTVAAAQLPKSPPSPASYQPGVSTWVNTVWSISLAFSLACTFFGVSLKRWASRYLLLLQDSPQIDPRIPRSRPRPRRHRSQVAEEPDPDTFGPSMIVALMHLFLPLSVFLFYFGLMLFLIGIGVSPSLVVVSSLVIAGVLYVFCFPSA
jgi:hypothetical protein